MSPRNIPDGHLSPGVLEHLAAVRVAIFDFDGVFTDNTVLVTQEGLEAVRCWRSDGLGLSLLGSIGVRAVIVSTETNPVVSARGLKLAVPVRQGVRDKGAAVVEVCAEFGVDVQEAMFVGNDVNDIPAFQVVGMPVAVADAYPEVIPFVRIVTKKPGGFGAVREICDMVYSLRANRGTEERGY